jgi:hypothetical protein
VPEVGHDHERMFQHALAREALFGPITETAEPTK